MRLNNKIVLSALVAAALTFTGCSDSDDTTTPTSSTTETTTSTDKETLAGTITTDMTLTADKVWVLDGLVTVENGATLTVEAGTTIVGKDGTGDATSYLIVDKGSKIMAEGTADAPIIFTSELAYDGSTAAVGQWGGLTIIGNAANDQVSAYEVNSAYVPGTSDLADNSGILTYVSILNSGITMAQDKEINGLSLVGVGSGTTIDNITVDLSDDDGIELWGGTVNLSNITISRCTDDHFDIDDGYSGTVTNLNIHATEFDGKTGNAGIEMSGTTNATFDGVQITMDASGKEGAIYFKKDGIGGTFKDVTITNNLADTYSGGSIFSEAAADTANISFQNVTIGGTYAGADFINKTDATTDSADEIKTIFDAGKGNTLVSASATKSTLAGSITTNTTLTSDKIWILDGLVSVEGGATLTIEAGTIIAGKDGTGDATSYLIVDKDSKIVANGTALAPVTFTSEKVIDGEKPAIGQWGGLTIIGNAANDQVSAYEVNSAFVAGTSDLADNSGTLTYVRILNSGITMAQDKEINGLSLVGVGSGTTINNIDVVNSDDDGIELWGGTVNLSDIYITRCTDDHFDIDDGYAGTVTNLEIHAVAFSGKTGNAGIEMSGTTDATFDGVQITMDASGKEGAIYFKKDGIGGHFSNTTITNNLDDTYAGGSIFSEGVAATANISFATTTIGGSFAGTQFVNKTDAATDSADEIKAIFDAQ